MLCGTFKNSNQLDEKQRLTGRYFTPTGSNLYMRVQQRIGVETNRSHVLRELDFRFQTKQRNVMIQRRRFIIRMNHILHNAIVLRLCVVCVRDDIQISQTCPSCQVPAREYNWSKIKTFWYIVIEL